MLERLKALPPPANQAQSPLPVWTPHPANKPQQAAYSSPAFETLYGGAAGGGKSDLLLGLARCEHHSSLLLRRAFPELERSLIERSHAFYGPREAYNAGKHVWRVDGRRIEFGHMEHVGTPQAPRDEGQYASAQYDFIGFDQLEQFPEYAYTFMVSRARTAQRGQRVRIVGSANPVGEGVEWIMRRWAAWLDEKHHNPASPGELRWYKRDADGKENEVPAGTPGALSRTFIPAGLKNNPYIDAVYRDQLDSLDEPLRSALLDGIWTAMLTDDAYQVIPRAWVKAAQERWTADGYKGKSLSAVGMDVSRGGDDETVDAPLFENWYAPLIITPGAQAGSGALAIKPLLDWLMQQGAAKPTGRMIDYPQDGIALPIVECAVTVAIDAIGIGSSAYDAATVQGIRYATAINWAAQSRGRDKTGRFQFVNKRAEDYWNFRQSLDPRSGLNIALPPDPRLLSDLCAPRYEVQRNGIKIEDKDDMKKRLGRSPDRGEAVILASAGINSLAAQLRRLLQSQRDGADEH